MDWGEGGGRTAQSAAFPQQQLYTTDDGQQPTRVIEPAVLSELEVKWRRRWRWRGCRAGEPSSVNNGLGCNRPPFASSWRPKAGRSGLKVSTIARRGACGPRRRGRSTGRERWGRGQRRGEAGLQAYANGCWRPKRRPATHRALRKDENVAREACAARRLPLSLQGAEEGRIGAG